MVPRTESSRRLPWLTLRDAMLVTLLLIATALVLGKNITVGGFRFGDSAAHAMDGVLIHDWVAEGAEAWSQPMDFALKQYAYYPTLGMGRHYPPGFAIVEAVFFWIFGISVVVARMCVVFFGFVAAVGTYVFVRPLANRPTAVFAGLILLTMPATTIWGRQTMLELPTLTVLIWAGVSFSWYLRRPAWSRLFVLLTVSVLAVLFKQTGLFLVGGVALTLGVCAARGRIPVHHFLCSVAVAGASGAATVLLLGRGGLALLLDPAMSTGFWSWDALTYYVRVLPDSVGVVVIGCAVLGIMLSRRRLGAHWTFLVLWVVSDVVMLTTAEYKDARFIYPGLFPFAVFAAIAGMELFNRIRITGVRVGLMSVGAIGLVAAGMADPVPHRPDYGAVVARHADSIHQNVVLFSGLRDGDFVFAVRQLIPWRQAVIVRGSKLLYTCCVLPDLDFVSRVSSMEELDRLMRKYAFDFVFVEQENKLQLTEDALLREYLERSSAYRLRETYPMTVAAPPSFRNVQIDVYEGIHADPRKIAYLDIPIPRINRTVRLPLDQSWN